MYVHIFHQRNTQHPGKRKEDELNEWHSNFCGFCYFYFLYTKTCIFLRKCVKYIVYLSLLYVQNMYIYIGKVAKSHIYEVFHRKHMKKQQKPTLKTDNKNDNENENIAEFMMCHWRSIISLYHVYSRWDCITVTCKYLLYYTIFRTTLILYNRYST